MKNMIKKFVSLLLIIVFSMLSFAFAEDDEEVGIEYISFAVAKEMFEEKFNTEVKFRLQYVTETDGKKIINSFITAEAEINEVYLIMDMHCIYLDGKNIIKELEELFDALPLEEVRDETVDKNSRAFYFIFNEEADLLVEKTKFEEFLEFCEGDSNN